MFLVFQHPISSTKVAELVADGLASFFAMLLSSLTVMYLQGGDAVHYSASVAVQSSLGFALLIPFHCGLIGVYREGAKPHTQQGMLLRIAMGCALGALMAYQLAIKAMDEIHHAHLLLGFAVVYLLAGLFMVRRLLVKLWGGTIAQQRVLIIGTGLEALSVAQDLTARRNGSHRVVGLYPAGDVDASVPVPIRALPVFDESQKIDDIITQHGVNQIIVAVREHRGGRLPMAQLLEARIHGVPVMDLATFYEQTTGEVPLESLKTSFLVYGQGFSQGHMRTWVKRIFDILASASLIVLTAPIMLLAMVAIRLDSPGPVIYRQERVGLGGRVFTCMKFRSMRTDAEANGVAVWALKNDARVTRVGQFMRKTRIDELPQLFSVLAGKMSMAGPRPERPSFVAQLKEQIPFYDLRHSVKPGLTGWAQVHYSYGASLEDAVHKHQYDLYYVKNNSLWLDILVLFETVSVVLFREGAQ